ncbi:MAG: hypothetical protein OEO18_17735 [Gammaproteobacteria bacterium]|nr:hypothetical protein [Gammaproteobacteria bacterium]
MSDACVAIVVPDNAYLGGSGSDWVCMRGYRALDGACEAIKIPPNGYLSGYSYGPGWDCDRGFRKAEAGCLAVAVPENAHLDFSGHDWVCNKPGIKRGLACTSVDRDD